MTYRTIFGYGPTTMRIEVDSPDNVKLRQMLQAHHEDMLKNSPQESVHALDMTSFKDEDITFWTVWIDDELAGCGALKRLSEVHAEIKSMRTDEPFLRRGVAGKLLAHILDFAKSQSYQKVSLETGSMDVFNPARRLYMSFGFEECLPFSDYNLDPYSVFFSKTISN